jgi:hypothetical protein
MDTPNDDILKANGVWPAVMARVRAGIEAALAEQARVEAMMPRDDGLAPGLD